MAARNERRSSRAGRGFSPDEIKLEAALEGACQVYRDYRGIEAIWRQDCRALSTGREPFGYRDSIGYPAIEGSGITGTNSRQLPLKAGEFVLGYPDQTGSLPPMPRPDSLGRNGTYVAFRCSGVPVFRWDGRRERCPIARAGSARGDLLLARLRLLFARRGTQHVCVHSWSARGSRRAVRL